MSQPIEGHIVQRYDGELGHLHLLVLEMGGLVLNQAQLALRALAAGDRELSLKIISRDEDVNDLELRADEEIVTVIARRGPVARDLRAVIAISKAIADLERVGDEAGRIANMALNIHAGEGARGEPAAGLLEAIDLAGKQACALLQEALSAFDALDIEKAEALVLGESKTVADLERSLRRADDRVMKDGEAVSYTVNVVLIIKALERIGEHARNLADYVVYLVKGQDVRHRARNLGA